MLPFRRSPTRLLSLGTAALLSMAWPYAKSAQAADGISEEDQEYVELEKAERFFSQQRQIASDATEFKQPSSTVPAPAPAAISKDPAFSGTLAYQAFSQYNSYGVVIQNQGISNQPFLNLRYRIHEDKRESAFLNNATIFLTSWSDISTNTRLSNPTSPYRYFTETDLIVGLSLIMAKRINATFNLVSYVSPAGAYGFGSWARGTFVYDDSKLLHPTIALKPQISLVYTLPGSSSISLLPTSFLIEPGITPTINIWGNTNHPATLSFPIRVGLGSRFYNGNTYGFTSFGPQFSVRLPALSGKSFSTNLGLGYLYYNLGPTTTQFSPNKQSQQNVFNLGLYVNF